MKNGIQIGVLLILSLIFNQAHAQSRQLLGKIYEMKKELRLSSDASVKLESFKKAQLDILTEIKDLEVPYFLRRAEGKLDLKLKNKLQSLYNKKRILVNEIKKQAIDGKDEALFLELVSYIRPQDLRDFLRNKALSDAHRLFYKDWFDRLKYTEVGTKLKHFSLDDQQGNPIDTKKMKGKTIWIDSWASKCGPCIKKLKQMKTVYTLSKNKGFEVLAVSWDYSKTGVIKNLDDAKKDWKKVINKHGFNWLNVFDHGDKIMEGQFGSTGKNLLVASDGVILGYNLSVFEVDEMLQHVK